MSVIQTDTTAKADEGPLYRRIQNTLRDRVSRGVWERGQMLPSRRHLCVEFSTTNVTLDKAIQGLIREGVLRASRGSGTFVADITSRAGALRIGVVIKRDNERETLEEHWDNNFYFGPLFEGIRDAVSGQPVEIMYSHIERGNYERYFREMDLDGLITVLPTFDDLPALHVLHEARVPFIATGFSTNSPGDAQLPCVDVDNRQGARDAVKHLLDLGHRRIAIINLALSQANHHDRLDGYLRAMSDAAIPLSADDLVLYPAYDAGRFETLIDQWIRRILHSLPTAIFVCDYFMTLATLCVLRRHGIRVPEDVSIVCFDDMMSAAHLTPPLTAVRQPVVQVGRVAARRLLTALQDEPEASPLRGTEILPVSLIVRESTAPPRSA